MATRVTPSTARGLQDRPITGPREHSTAKIMGARIAAITESATVATIIDSAVAERGHWTITANLAHIRQYQRDPVAANLIDSADLTVADGAPLILAGRVAGTPLPERVAGSDLIWSISEECARHGLPLFLLGGSPGVALDAAAVLRDRFHELEICGTACPAYGFERDEHALLALESEIVSAAPAVVFVALGFPKQDILITRLRAVLPGASFIGIGIGLSFVAGDVPRAAPWAQAVGLEWLHRLIQEPRRLARRYLVEGIPFAARLFSSAALFRVRTRLTQTPRSSRWGVEDHP